MFTGSPIRINPFTRLGAAGDKGSHFAATDDNAAAASSTNTKIKECLAGLFNQWFRWWQREGEKPESLLSIRAVGSGRRWSDVRFDRVGRMIREIRHISTEMSGRTSQSAGNSSGTHLYKACVGTAAQVVNGTWPYWDGFVYCQGRPAFNFGDLRHDNGSACGRADEMQGHRTKEWGVRQVTRCDTYPGGKVLKA